MTVTATPVYGAAGTITITLASLASDSNLIAGRASTAVDNTSDLAIDSLVGGFVTTSTGSAPTDQSQIEVWTYGSYDGTTYSAGATGVDANFSPTGEKTLMQLLTIIPTDATTSHKYEWGPFSVAMAFGGTMPSKWGIYMVQNTGQNLSLTTANQQVKYTPIKYQSA